MNNPLRMDNKKLKFEFEKLRNFIFCARLSVVQKTLQYKSI